MAHIDLRVHLSERHCCAGTCAHPQISRPPVAKLFVLSNTRRTFFNTDWSTPMLPHLFKELLTVFGSGRPWIVFSPDALGIRPNHYECQSFFRVCRGKQAAH